jgi:outer membrane receptor protein involved in Fe transport
MENYSHRLMLGCSAAALLLSIGSAAYAQEASEVVTVSSTRLQNAGFDAPTPTTVIGAADLAKTAQPSVFEAMTQLPSLQGSTGVSYNTGSTTTGLQGISSLNLRGLGVLRTLTLLDNQRVVAANPNGAVDVSQMPQMLIQRVDVVTGGASASWGSDAVAGVVNFVTDKKFEGFKANFNMGQTTYGDDQNMTFQAAAGTSFLGGRAHIEVAGEYSYTAGVEPTLPVAANQFGTVENVGGRPFFSQHGIVSYTGTPTATTYINVGGIATLVPLIPAGQPQNNFRDHVQPGQTYPTAIVLSGPKEGTVFGANGMAQAYDYAGGCTALGNGSATGAGTIVGSFNGTCVGTAADPGDQTSHQFTHSLADPLTRGDVYARVSYDLAPGTDIYATVNMSTSRTQDIPAQGNSNRNGIAVKCDNAFIAQSGLFGIGLPYQQTIAACNATYANQPAQTLLDSGGISRTIVAAQNYAGITPGANSSLEFYNVSGGQGGNGNGLVSDPVPTGYLVGGVQAPVQAFDIATQSANINQDQIVDLTRDMRRFVVGGEGGFSIFGSDWAWDSYAELGQNDVSIRLLNMPLKNRYNLAIDAIQDPVTGAIECRDPVARANGCVPYNPFTTSAPSPAAIAYIDNQSNGARNAGQLARQVMEQDAFSLNFSSTPVEDWAGKISIATGFDYRQEKFWQQADPYAGGITASTPASFNQPCTDPSIDCVASGTIVNGTAHVNPGNWNAGNYTSGQGNYHVWELYLESGIPLINDSTFGKADLDIAGRFERYSTAGDIVTWKVGLTWDTPIPGIRFRTLQSRDVRAPNLADLFLPKQTLNGSFNNDYLLQVTGNASGNAQQVGQTNAGNPLLQPEKGTTTELGLVFQPDWLPGFQTSFDYYRIAVKGIISASGVQTVEDLCYQGFTSYCSQQFIATKNGLPQTAVAGNTGDKGNPNEVLAIVAVPFNSAGLLTDGFDVESQYNFELNDWNVPGQFSVRSLVNHTMKFLADPGVAGQFVSEKAGVLGGGFNSDTYSANTGNVLTWKITEAQDWQGDSWSFNIQERWYAGGVMNGKWTTANNPLGLPTGDLGLHYLTCNPGSCPAPTTQMPTIDYQKVSSTLYLDVGGTYNWSEKTQFYFHIDNIANQSPPNTGGNEVNNTLYDVLGRMYRVGVRFND